MKNKNRYKPYFSFSGGLSGLGSLGDVSPEIQTMATQNQNNIEKIISHLESEANQNKKIMSFDDNDLLYNIGITKEQKQAWVYYKRKTLKIPMLGGWKKYYLKGDKENLFGTQNEIDSLISDRALFYSDGNVLPYAVYSWGNMYTRERQLMQDKDYIIAQYGEAVFLDHLDILNKAKPKQLRIDDDTIANRVIISATSTTSKTFSVKEIRPEFMTEVSESELINKKGRQVKTDRRINLNFNGENSYPLRDIFNKWLYTLDPKRYFEGKTSAFEIYNYYVLGMPVAGEDRDLSAGDKADMKNNAREFGEKLFALFLREVLTDSDIKRLNDAWNEKYNGWSDLNYSTIPIGLETSATFLNQGFAIRKEKRDAIAYMEAAGSGILAYDVGVGKTVSALLELSNALHQGKCKRPLVIVPNPTYNNWLKETVGGTDKQTGETFSGILTGLGYKVNDWYNLNVGLVKKLDAAGTLDQLIPDGTITFMSYEGFKQLGFSQNVNMDFISDLKEILQQKVTDPVLSTGNTGMDGLGALDKEAVKLMAELGSLGKREKGEKTERDKAKEEKDYLEIIGLGNKNSICDIDVLGFDYIIIDEAHRCKAIFSGVKSDEEGKKNYLLQGNQSSTGIKAFFICNYIQKTFGRNVMLLTATPFTNSPLEVYSMLSLVALDMLKETGYYNINDFFTQFAKVDMEFVVKVDGSVDTKEIIKGFNNRQVLQRLIFTKVNYKTGEDVGVQRPCKINLPMLKKLGQKQSNSQNQLIKKTEGDLQGIKPKSSNNQVLTYLEMTETQAENQENIYSAMNTALTTRVGKGIDKSALFRALSHSLDNALSPYLYSKNESPTYKEFVENSPKIKYVCECIRTVKEHHKETGTEMSGQVIYSNRGVNYFFLIKQYLEREIGFKDQVIFEGHRMSEVMIISGGEAKEKTDKEVIKDAFNAGIVKVIIGSATIREGINLQKRGTCLYDMYPDWNPTDVRQLEGRIWRQGNRYGFVRVVMPLVENSMDVFVFQKLEEKTSRINDLFYREGSSNMLDLDSIDPNQIKYALIRDISQLARIDFAIERQQLKNSVQLLAEDVESIKSLSDAMETLIENRQEALNVVHQAKEKIESYIQYFSREDYQDDDRVKENIKRAKKYLIDIADLLDNPNDDVLVRMQQKIENWNNRAGYSYTVWAYQIKSFTESYREVKKKEREVLKPKGYSLDSDFTAIGAELEKEFDKRYKDFIRDYGDSDDDKNWPKTKRYKEIYDEIIRKKAELNVNGQPVEDRVSEFASLNYLLDYTASEITSGQCDIPKPGERTKPKLVCPPLDEKGIRRIDKEGLLLLTHCIEQAPVIKDMHIDAHGNYTQTRVQLHQSIIDEIKNQKPCRVDGKPIAILTGGAPGSGKTSFINKYAPWMESGKLFKIDADEIRSKLPEYKGWNAFNTQSETRDIVHELLKQIGNPCESDVIYDGTMNKAGSYEPLIANLKKLGYQIFVIYIQVPKEVSIERAMSRYKRKGRYVPIEVIEEVYKNGLNAYEQVIKHADGFIRVDGVTQQIIEQGGKQLPKERNYEFAQDISDKGIEDLDLLELEAEALMIELELLTI